MNTDPSDTPYKIGEAARILGVSVDTIRRWEAEGKIVGTRTPGGTRQFDPAEIDRVRHGRHAA